jgi:phosphatidate cytidylyltransferase
MAKPKKDVKFQHRGSNGKMRRPSTSMSEISENASEPGSPTRNGAVSKPDPVDEPPQQSEYEKKKANFITRTIWTFVMIAGFFWSMFAGHIYIIIVVTAVQIISFKEVIAISNVPSRARSLRFTKALNWYFLGTIMYFLYGESVIYYFKHILLVDRVLLPFATHHRFISFMLYIIGMFVHRQPRASSDASHRLHFLRQLAPERPLQVPVHPVRLEPHGLVLDRWPGALCHQQYI